MNLPSYRPMLAAPEKGRSLSTLVGTHGFDVKLDGLRCLLYFDGTTVRLVNRSGANITAQFPEVAQSAQALPYTMVLDGELMANTNRFEDVARRGKQNKPADIAACMAQHPCSYVAFDLLHLSGDDLSTRRWLDRRTVLDGTALAFPDIITTSVWSPEGLQMWDTVKAMGLEGLIAKSYDAPYLQGKRSPAWLKYKTTQTITCVAVGYEPGSGARAHFGAMHLAVIGPDGPVSVGRVGTGFTDREITDLKQQLDAHIPVVVEIEALNRTSTNQLRFPVYKGVRTDLSVVDARLDQLDLLPRSG